MDAGEPGRGADVSRHALGSLPAAARPARHLGEAQYPRLPDDPARGVHPASYHNRAYEGIFINIGWGVTITDPHAVARMTNAMDVRMGDKVLEIGTGSGYQSAYLSHLTDKIWSVEIIKPLADRTRRLYDALIERGYTEYQAITTKHADGYYGWEQEAPFDRIIVTCGIDHIPPPLMQQLKPNGVMMIPIGPPGAQNVLKVAKTQQPDGSITVARTDIYNGGKLVQVPFAKLEGETVKGRHTAK